MESKKAHAKAAALLSAVAALLFSACTSSIAVTLSESGTSLARAAFTAEFPPAAERVAQAFLGQDAVFDREAIESAFAAIDFPSPTTVSVEGEGLGRLKIEFSRINLDERIFLNLTDGNTRAFSLDRRAKRFTITLTEETIAKTVAALPQELFEYADLLMAPVLTGESMSEEEYLGLIAAAYGPQSATDLKACSFELTVQCPGEVVAAFTREFAGGSLGGASSPAADVDAAASGREARFTIPAVKVFALSCPLQLVVVFRA